MNTAEWRSTFRTAATDHARRLRSLEEARADHPLECSPRGQRHVRAKNDDAIRMVGAKGSVMGTRPSACFSKRPSRRRSTASLDHFDYVRKMIGPQHLGVGATFDLWGYDKMPPPNTTAEGWLQGVVQLPR